MTRYFIVFFEFRAKTKEGGGSLSLKVEGGFPSRFTTKKHVVDGVEGIKPEDVSITSILELNENDFEDWERE